MPQPFKPTVAHTTTRPVGWKHGDNVVLVNDKGERLETEHLVWSHDSDLVYTTRPVSIETAQGMLRGRGLRSDSHFERYEILNPTGSFEVGG